MVTRTALMITGAEGDAAGQVAGPWAYPPR